jgi:hypothetical protein
LSFEGQKLQKLKKEKKNKKFTVRIPKIEKIKTRFVELRIERVIVKAKFKLNLN